MGNKSGKLSPQNIQEYTRYVDFSPDEIHTWYTEYQHSLRDGQKELTKEEFKAVYNSLFVGDASKFAEHVFRTFDKDGNGTVNFKEFLVGLCVSGSDHNTDDKLKWAFDMYDINGDGFIEKHEMKEILEAIYKMTNALELGTTDFILDNIFKEIDANQDGRICFQEFKSGSEKIPMIINLLQCDPDPEVEG